jgi:hypothetical protein
VIAIGYEKGQRRAQGASLAKPGENLDLVALELLTRRAPIALLASPEVFVDAGSIKLKARG